MHIHSLGLHSAPLIERRRGAFLERCLRSLSDGSAHFVTQEGEPGENSAINHYHSALVWCSNFTIYASKEALKKHKPTSNLVHSPDILQLCSNNSNILLRDSQKTENQLVIV